MDFTLFAIINTDYFIIFMNFRYKSNALLKKNPLLLDNFSYVLIGGVLKDLT